MKRIICLFLVLCMGISAFGCSKDEATDADRDEKTETTDKDREMIDGDKAYVMSENFEVTNAMMSYFFNSQYQNMAQSLQQMGIDTAKSLKAQMYSGDKTWFDYIMQDVTIPQVKQILVLCEAAKAEGFELSEHEREHIDEAIIQIEKDAEHYAKEYGGTKMYYIRTMYGYGVNLSDIRKAMELNQLAAAYSEYLVDSYNFTEAELNEYLDGHKDEFLVEVEGSEPALEEYLTRNVRVIFLSAGDGSNVAESRDAILKEFESGDKSEESFAELAKTHSHDSEAHENGGLYENQAKGELVVDELEDWLFADERKVGDYTSVSNGKTGTEEVIYIVYYTGEGMKKWHRDADNALTQEAYDADYAKIESTYTVSVDIDGVYKIPAQAGAEL